MPLQLFTDNAFIQQLKDIIGEGVDKILSPVTEYAASMNMANMIFMIAAIAVGLFACIWGYRAIKLVSGISFAVTGFTAGVAFFDFLTLQEGMEGLAEMAMLAYIIGAVLALLFLIFGYKQYKFVMFYTAITLASSIVWGFTGDHVLTATISILFAIIAMCMVRVSATVYTSFWGAFLAVSAVAEIFFEMYPADQFDPATILNLSVSDAQNDLGLLVALGVGALFTILQFIFWRGYEPDNKD